SSRGSCLRQYCKTDRSQRSPRKGLQCRQCIQPGGQSNSACRRPGSRMRNDIHDLGLVLDAPGRLVVIGSWASLRVMGAIATLAVKRSQTWYTWNQVEGLQRLGFGTALDASEDMSDPEHALDYIRRQNEPALFVFCDLHPFMQSPRVVRLLKMIAMNPEE